MTSSMALPAAVLVPIGLAVLTAVVRGRATIVVGLLGTLIASVVAGAVAVEVAASGPISHEMAGWAPPLGIVLRADGLSAVFLALCAVVGSATAVYAAARADTYGNDPRFWPLLLLLIAGIVGALVTGDLFNAFVALEIITLTSVGLVALGGRPAWGPALRYLMVAVLGSMLYLVAIAMVYGMTGTLDIPLAGARIAADPTADTRWPLALAVLGLGLKSALLPLHAWLPPAHASAPAAVSPVLSALVVKAGFVILVRVWFDVLGPDRAVAVVLAACAAAAVLVGGTLALVQASLKRIIAYSTVAQVGYLFLLFPLTTLTDDPAVRGTLWSGVILLAVAHGLAKAALFFAAGSLKSAAGGDELDVLGAAGRIPGALAMTLMLTAVSLVGLPVSLGFAGKWALVSGAVESSQWWAVLLLVVGSVLTAAYLLRAVSPSLRSVSAAGVSVQLTVSPALRLVPLSLALLVVALGIATEGLAELSFVGASLGSRP